MTAPLRERPQAPAGYGYSSRPEGMLDWDRVSAALADAGIYWITTIRPDGAPHTHPIWGGFVGRTVYFEGGPTTRWGRNLAVMPKASFGVESDGLHISGRGPVEKGMAGSDLGTLKARYGRKYEYEPSNDDFYCLRPQVIIAIDASSMEAFASSPTRFRFDS